MDRYNDTNKVSVLAIIVNILLFIIKIIVAILSKSQGMLADAINSGTDIFNSVMMYIGNKIASKPSDKDHPYGHGKVEYVFSLIISISMILLSFKILQNSVIAIVTKQQLIFSYSLILVCVITIIVKICLYFYTIRMSKIHDNLLITATAEDHRNDIFISLTTLIGIVSSKYGIHYVDGLVGIIISIWISYVAVKLFVAAYKVLIDTDIDDVLKEKILKTISDFDNCNLDSIKSTPVGVNYILLIEISVSEDITLGDSHDIAENIKKEVCKYEKIVDAIVHVNPVSKK